MQKSTKKPLHANTEHELLVKCRVKPDSKKNWKFHFIKFKKVGENSNKTHDHIRTSNDNGAINIKFIKGHFSFSIFYLLQKGFVFSKKHGHPFFITTNNAPVSFNYQYRKNRRGLLLTLNYLKSDASNAGVTHMGIQLAAHAKCEPKRIICSQDPLIGVEGPKGPSMP